MPIAGARPIDEVLPGLYISRSAAHSEAMMPHAFNCSPKLLETRLSARFSQ
jgi:hypothetical protein